MQAIDMKINTPYRAITGSSDGTIEVGQIMWLSSNGLLNLPYKYGGGFLLESEWKAYDTVDFEVEEALDFYILFDKYSERLCKK